MSPLTKYSMLGVSAVAAIVLGSWPLLDPAGRSGVLTAALIAVPVQIGAFALLHGSRAHVNRFLAAWVGGTLVRMAVLAVAAFVVIRADAPGAVPMLLALAGFFFGLLLLEPVCFRDRLAETLDA